MKSAHQNVHPDVFGVTVQPEEYCHFRQQPFESLFNQKTIAATAETAAALRVAVQTEEYSHT